MLKKTAQEAKPMSPKKFPNKLIAIIAILIIVCVALALGYDADIVKTAIKAIIGLGG